MSGGWAGTSSKRQYEVGVNVQSVSTLMSPSMNNHSSKSTILGVALLRKFNTMTVQKVQFRGLLYEANLIKLDPNLFLIF